MTSIFPGMINIKLQLKCKIKSYTPFLSNSNTEEFMMFEACDNIGDFQVHVHVISKYKYKYNYFTSH